MKRGAETLEQAADVWAETLGDMSNVAYIKAHIQARTTCSYPPTPADVLAAHREISARPAPSRQAIPQRTRTPTAVALKHLANLRAVAHDAPMPNVDVALDVAPEAFEHYHARIASKTARRERSA